MIPNNNAQHTGDNGTSPIWHSSPIENFIATPAHDTNQLLRELIDEVKGLRQDLKSSTVIQVDRLEKFKAEWTKVMRENKII